jgi:two-component system sporulation sensor kinase C
MNQNDHVVSTLEKEWQVGDEDDAPHAKPTIGICVQDRMVRRLIEAASIQIGFAPQLIPPLDAAQSGSLSLSSSLLATVELIVVDEVSALGIRNLLNRSETRRERINPAIILVLPESSPDAALDEADGDLPDYRSSEVGSPEVGSPEAGSPEVRSYDGILKVPQPTDDLAAQLSVILYAHRAFATRFQSTLDELHLSRRIFRSVTSGISVSSATQPGMPLTYVNPAFEVMTGYHLEEVIGRNCRFLQGDLTDQAALTLVREALRDEREVTVVLKNFRKDGTPFWNELSLSPIRNRESKVTHFVGIQTNVTSRVEFEAALRESEKLAAVGRLASSIAHEINNPLESVMNLVYLAQHSDSLAQSQDYLAIADKELQRVKHITSQSLRFSRQSSKAQSIGCTELLTSVLDLYQSRLMNGHITVQRRDRSTQSVVCMESEIRQVLNNLVSNAIDAMYPQGAGRLVVRTREGTQWRTQRRGVILTIADTGSGIASEVMSNMYKAFYSTKGIGGTGLGLWISSEIIDRHQGRLTVRSSERPGYSGTVFQLFLPLQGVSA